MATVDVTTYPTIWQMANELDPSGDLAMIVDILMKTNQGLMDIPATEGNGALAHKVVRTAYVGGGGYRALNEASPVTGHRTVSLFEPIALYDGWSEADVEVIKVSPNPMASRMMHAKMKLQRIARDHADTLVYGNVETDPDSFTGWANRLADIGDMCLDGGASGGSSIYVVQAAPDKAHFVYPRGATDIGIGHEDKGIQTKETTTPSGAEGLIDVYRDKFMVKLGFVEETDRCIGRIANLAVTGSSNIFDPADLVDLLNRFDGDRENCIIYCNRTIKTQMDNNALAKSNGFYTMPDIYGRPITHFQGTPVRRMDAILDTEAEVT